MMTTIPKIDAEEISTKARNLLLQLLKEGRFSEAGKLPPEENIAQSMGVSRSVIRDVLANLESEGFITRRRGIGTLINDHVLKVSTRLDLEVEFLDLITEAGYEPGVAFVNYDIIPADEEAAKRLCICVGDKVLRVERLLLADQIPAIYCLDYIAAGLVQDDSISDQVLQLPIFNFLESYCHTKVEMELTEIQPYKADRKLAHILGIKEDDLLLYLDEVGYNLEKKPVLWAQEYYRNGVFKFTVLRRKI